MFLGWQCRWGQRTLWRQGDGSIDGASGSDLLVGGRGDDVLGGGDPLSSPSTDRLRGGPGNDALGADSGNNKLDGGRGHDTVWFSDLAGPAIIDLEADSGTQGSWRDSLRSIEKVHGGSANDQIAGTKGPTSSSGEAVQIRSAVGRGGQDLDALLGRR